MTPIMVCHSIEAGINSVCNICCCVIVCLEQSIGLGINNDQEWNTNNLHNPLPEEQQMIF